MKKYLCLLLLLLPVVGGAQIITTIAGTGSTSFSGDGVAATIAGIPNPIGGAFDRYGNYYFADGLNSNRIRKITVSSGLITTVAGNGAGGFNGDSIAAITSKLYRPQAVVFDTIGNFYIADKDNHRIRKVDISTGLITTIAGTGVGGFSGDGGPATAAKILGPNDICLDKFGNLYVADLGNHRLRKISTAGIISTFAGPGASAIGDGGAATDALINAPQGVTSDYIGNIYIADASTCRIRKVDTLGIISTIAGNGSYIYAGDGIPATSANINPIKITFDYFRNLIIADSYNKRVFKVDTSGILYCIGGNGSTGFSGDGGGATAASIDYPGGVSFDFCNNLYVTDINNRRIRKITYPSTPSLSITTPPAIAIGAAVTITASITGGCCSSYSYLWMNHGAVFSTTTTPTVTYTKTNGTDSITVKVVGCGDTTVSSMHVVTVDKTATSLFPSKGGMTCYPNPVLGELHIVSPYEIDAITISDPLGREVYSISDKATTERVINTASLPTGVYIIRIWLSGGGVSVGRFLKE